MDRSVVIWTCYLLGCDFLIRRCRDVSPEQSEGYHCWAGVLSVCSKALELHLPDKSPDVAASPSLPPLSVDIRHVF